MSELVFDQEWMAILEAMGSLPMVDTVSLSFRVPVPLPVQAFTALLKLSASSLETLILSGLQLSTSKVPTCSSSRRTSDESLEDPLEGLIHACQSHGSLTTIQVCRYRPVKTTVTKDGSTADPLFRALLQLPRLRVLHIEKSDIFSDPMVLDMVCRSPIPTLKLGDLERSTRLEQYLPSMAASLEENAKLKELIIHHTLQGDSLVAMAQFLRTNTSLQTVSLRIHSNDFGTHLAVALGHNTTLQSLGLDLMADRKSFRQNLTLMATSWGNNHHSSLTTLKLDARGIGHLGSSAILQNPIGKMLREDNFVLEHLLINRDTIPLHQDVLFYLKLNQLGRNHFLRRRRPRNVSEELGLVASRNGRNHTFREEWVEMLIQNKADVRVLHYFISRNPLILPVAPPV